MMTNKICVNTRELFDRMVEDLSKEKILVFDTETTGLNISKLKILGISLYNGGNTAYYVPINHYQATQLGEAILPEIKNLLISKELIIAHNIVYDTKVLNKYKIELDTLNWFDTMVAAHLCYEERPAIGLKALAKAELKMDMKQLTDVIEIDKLEFADVEKMSNYSCDDVIATFGLYNMFSKELNEKELMKLFTKIEMPFLKVIKRMEENGVLIDVNRFNAFEKTLVSDIGKIEGEINKVLKLNTQTTLFDKSRLNIDLDSPKQLGDILYNKLQLPIMERTETGQPKTGSDILEKMKDKHPVIPTLIEYRKLKKMLNAFIQPLPKKIDADNRIRASFHDCGTKTGRLSSSDPNLQQLPKEDTYDVRGCFIASPGYKIMAADYSQEELRVAAHICDDPTMIKAFELNQDLHLTVANKVFCLNLNEKELIIGNPEYEAAKKKHKDFRNMSKFISFGLLYGAGPEGLSNLTGKSTAEAKEMMDSFFKQFPNVKQKIKQTEYTVSNFGFVRSMFHRRRNFKKEPRMSKAFRQAFNFLIQGACSDILRKAMIEIDDFIKQNNNESRILMTVHDEIVLEVPEQKVGFYKENIKRIMENTMTLKVKLVAELGEGDSYGEAK